MKVIRTQFYYTQGDSILNIEFESLELRLRSPSSISMVVADGSVSLTRWIFNNDKIFV